MKKFSFIFFTIVLTFCFVIFTSNRLFALTLPEVTYVDKELTLVLPNSGGIPIKVKGVYGTVQFGSDFGKEQINDLKPENGQVKSIYEYLEKSAS